MYLYRIGLGGVMGRRFVMIEHTGRTSGKTYQTVLEVIRHDESSTDVVAAWGPKTDWLRNIQANPEVRISIGRIRNAQATGHVVDEATAAAAFATYAEAHPKSAAALGKSLGLPLDDAQAMGEMVPLVRITLAAEQVQS